MKNVKNVISKRFVIRKSLVGKNVVIEFTNKKGVKVVYNHDIAFNIMKSKLENMNCFKKYKSYKLIKCSDYCNTSIGSN